MYESPLYIYHTSEQESRAQEIAQRAKLAGRDVLLKDVSDDSEAAAEVEQFTEGDLTFLPVVRIGIDAVKATIFNPDDGLLDRLFTPEGAAFIGRELPPPKIFSTSDNEPCELLKRWLASQGVEFNEVNVDKEPETSDRLIKWAGGRNSIPVIVYPGLARLFEPTVELLARLHGITPVRPRTVD
jgi:glutaredoxin